MPGSTPQLPVRGAGGLALQVADLLHNAVYLLEADRDAARRCLDTARGLLLEQDQAELAPRGGLAPWQQTRVRGYIDANLAAQLRIGAVAACVRLSASYFSRAFKASFGSPFSHYVMERRIDCARRMMCDSDEPLSQIALACGLADQAHFTRLFRKFVGMTPSQWRRMNGAPAKSGGQRGEGSAVA